MIPSYVKHPCEWTQNKIFKIIILSHLTIYQLQPSIYNILTKQTYTKIPVERICKMSKVSIVYVKIWREKERCGYKYIGKLSAHYEC